ncbi:MAG: polysaccharide deacetylase family protein [Kineosporiaceae bacterium]
MALTIDDGPDPTWTPRVLDLLASLDVRATFCVIGHQAAARPRLVADVVADWSVDPRGWSLPGTSSIVSTIMSRTRPGSIILEHDGGGDRSQTLEALRIALPRLLDQGYRFVQPR